MTNRKAVLGAWRRVGALAAASAAALPLVTELRVARPTQPLTDRWKWRPIAPRGTTLLGISLRPYQIAALGLDARSTLTTLLAYPFQLVRLGAYWQQCEPRPGAFVPDALDGQIAAAEQAGKQIIVCVGAIKNFGYPEFFVPTHHRHDDFVDGSLIAPRTQPRLLEAASAFITRVIAHYRDRPSIVAWQVEHEAIDPLGMEHSWRLATAFLAAEIQAVRTADATRPIVLNGFLPTTLLANLFQWWRTRDQGDSLEIAQRLADIVGVDYYPRYGLVNLAGRTLYLDGSRMPWQVRRRTQLMTQTAQQGRKLMITEGQAEPWETVTTPPDPQGVGMYSCLPEHLIDTYNQWFPAPARGEHPLYAYLFWGAEYWVRRQQSGDPRYLQAFARILEEGGSIPA
jgi:glycosyl hydrolase family 42 (putative beta-galactosidase)